MKRILLLQTGGTIAMQHHEEGGPATELDYELWERVLKHEIPQLHQIAEIDIQSLFFIDSSDIASDHWITLARVIQENETEYDGFVILHGTDTMAYTASALSYTLRPLQKPVIITGSQVPMSNIRSDARRNLINAIEMATHPINEVAICFNDMVYRGNRTTKMSIGDFDAFASPNFPPLAEIGLSIDFTPDITHPQNGDALKPVFDNRIYTVKPFPNMNPGLLHFLPYQELDVIVLEAFGTGNFPIKGNFSLIPFLDRCVSENIQLVVTSQAPYDSVDLTQYDSGKAALDRGALSAKDMTVEATLTKLMYLLGNQISRNELRKQFNRSLAGEITA